MEGYLLITNDSQLESIQRIIYEIRGQKVMLDFDLANVYGVKTSVLNQAVKRNMDRFPSDFMFRLKEDEWNHLFASGMISQFVTSSLNKRKKTAPPFAFTEYGAVMLASVLRSPSAIQMSVMVTRAFIAMRRSISTMLSVNFKVEQISHKVDQLHAYVEEILHDQKNINEQQERTNDEIAIQIEAINDALDRLREIDESPKRRIGFRQTEE